MNSIDINSVKKIEVKFSDGSSILFKEKGLEHFRRMMAKSPAYGAAAAAEPEEKPKKKKKSKADKSSDGYSVINLEYSKSGGSAITAAEAMRKQAEASGFKFG